MRAADLVVRCLETKVWNTSSAFPGGESLDCPGDHFENDRLLHQEIKERSAAI